MERSQVIAVPPLSWHRFPLSNITSDLGPHFVFTLPVASSFLGSIRRDLLLQGALYRKGNKLGNAIQIM